MTDILGYEDTEKIRTRMLLDEYRASPEGHQLAMQEALKRAGAMIQQQNQDAQAPTSLSALLQIDPSLLAVLAQKMPPGSKGYDLLQQAMAESQKVGSIPGATGGQTLGQPPQPQPSPQGAIGPGPAPVGPSPQQPSFAQPQRPQPAPLPLKGGRAAGSAKSPGGPRRTFNIAAGG